MFFEVARNANPLEELTSIEEIQKARQILPTEPPPFGRFIIRAALEQHRTVVFDTRDHEVRGSGNPCWKYAEDLPAEWDEAIDDYWFTYHIREDWDRRVKMVEELGLVRPVEASPLPHYV